MDRKRKWGREGERGDEGRQMVLLLDSRFIVTEGHWVVCHIKVKPTNASSPGLKSKVTWWWFRSLVFRHSWTEQLQDHLNTSQTLKDWDPWQTSSSNLVLCPNPKREKEVKRFLFEGVGYEITGTHFQKTYSSIKSKLDQVQIRLWIYFWPSLPSITLHGVVNSLVPRPFLASEHGTRLALSGREIESGYTTTNW